MLVNKNLIFLKLIINLLLTNFMQLDFILIFEFSFIVIKVILM